MTIRVLSVVGLMDGSKVEEDSVADPEDEVAPNELTEV